MFEPLAKPPKLSINIALKVPERAFLSDKQRFCKNLCLSDSCFSLCLDQLLNTQVNSFRHSEIDPCDVFSLIGIINLYDIKDLIF